MSDTLISRLISENINLRQKFAELLTKAEQYRDQATESMNLNELTAEKLKKADEKIVLFFYVFRSNLIWCIL